MRARIAYIETYFAGSHARIADLVRRHSRHDIEIYSLGPDHWRWRSLTAHHAFADLIARSEAQTPDAILVSGPVSLSGLLAMLPSRWTAVPRAVYFHETQWKYPSSPYDPRPYLVGHLDSLVLADRVWFNSAFHLNSCFEAARSDQSRRVRTLAQKVLDQHWHKASVVYPPVQVDQALPCEPVLGDPAPRICWVARWEVEKRPDLFVAAIERLRDAGIRFELAVFLGGSSRALESDPHYQRIAALNRLEAPPARRKDYERELARCDILVSTAEHEFFGVAAIEAAMLGVIPVVPNDLAYPETLPSAIHYPPGDMDELVGALSTTMSRKWRGAAPWRQDSRRFLPAKTIAAYDWAIDELLEVRR